jgi:esterase/lipase superfamily enzyme
MSTTSYLIIELLTAGPELEAALHSDWSAVRDEIIRLTYNLDDEEKRADVQRDLDALLDRLLLSAAAKIVRSILQKSLLATGDTAEAERQPYRSISDPEKPVHTPHDRSVVVPVYYATDRAWDDNPDPRRCYSGGRGTLGFGIARVSVPTHHKVGELESPRWWMLEIKPNPAKHVVLMDVRRMDADSFTQEARAALASSDKPAALVFVHGYNVAFANAARRAAQISVDLKFPGQTFIFSWPSLSETHLYSADEATIEWSTPHFEEFLQLVLTGIGARHVHVIAHSMGNRPLVRAIERLDPSRLPPGSASLRQIIFAAPDVDREVFLQIAAAFHGRAQRFTLYASSNDLALKISRILHRYPRAGDAARELVIMDGLDTIDASDADTSLFGLGHTYFAKKRSILNDIHSLILTSKPPENRFDLAMAISDLGRYWVYRS